MKVLYILGRGRSGSTILANVLGEIDGFFSAGEVRELWDPIVTRSSPCACGATIAQCEVWGPVLERLSDVDVEQVAGWQHEIVRESNIRRLLACRDGCGWPALDGYARVMERVYGELHEVTGCSVIVDSSKRPSYAAFLEMLDGVEAYFVHLTRDPRASAYSWRARKYESVRGGEVKQRNAFDSTLRWNLLNVGAEMLLRQVPVNRRLRLRYEDFAAEPKPTIERIRDLVGESNRALPFTDDRTVVLGPNHTIAGNPSRFRTGELVVRDTGEWREEQSPASRWIATALALPFLRRYGYGMRPPP